jgi:hypothetical protein
MAKNRKYQSAGVRFGPALKALLLCGIIGGAGVGYVWQKSQIGQLGDQRKEREQYLNKLKGQNADLRRQFETICTPANLGQRVRDLKLGMAPAQQSQVWSLAEPTGSPVTPASGSFQQIASQQLSRPARQ